MDHIPPLPGGTGGSKSRAGIYLEDVLTHLRVMKASEAANLTPAKWLAAPHHEGRPPGSLIIDVIEFETMTAMNAAWQTPMNGASDHAYWISAQG